MGNSVKKTGILLHQERLSEHTSLRVGGVADRYYEPSSIEDLQQFLGQLAPDEPITYLGLGSNVLVRDRGIRGTVIATQTGLNRLSSIGTQDIKAEAGVSCAQLSRFCARLHLAGAEFWAGIPGTVGGALAMNAGCAGSETWQSVVAVETLDRQGVHRIRPASDYQYGYREVIGHEEEAFVAGHFHLELGNKAEALARIRLLLDRRTATQPTHEPNCGSVFRNPPGDYAARLIEACGLKGMSEGGAMVSEKHANFIINTGTATAADIETLIERVAATVKQKQGIELIREVRMLGEV